MFGMLARAMGAADWKSIAIGVADAVAIIAWSWLAYALV